MELVFDVVSAPQQMPGLATSKTFKQAGGIIGRAESCAWVIRASMRASVIVTAISICPTPAATASRARGAARSWARASPDASSMAMCTVLASWRSGHA